MVQNIILDDSHACIDAIRDSFTLKFSQDHDVYKKVSNLFESDLEDQRAGTWMDIKSGDNDSMLPIPYWAWNARKSEVLQILQDNKDTQEVTFSWQIVKDSVQHYQALISGNRLEISPYLPPITMFNSFALSQHVIELLRDLIFEVKAEIFERALDEVGKLLGFACQRPDNEIRKGPDNLWGGVSDMYISFECKSEVSADRDAITKAESGQMNNHCAWFKEEYGEDTKAAHIMIIQTKQLSYHGNFTNDVTVMRKGKLKLFGIKF